MSRSETEPGRQASSRREVRSEERELGASEGRTGDLERYGVDMWICTPQYVSCITIYMYMHIVARTSIFQAWSQYRVSYMYRERICPLPLKILVAII